MRVWANPWDVFHRARRLEVVAVAGLLWIYSWCVLGAGFFRVFLSVFVTSNVHGLLQARGHLASCTSLLVMRPFFAHKAKKAFSYRGAYRVPLFN